MADETEREDVWTERVWMERTTWPVGGEPAWHVYIPGWGPDEETGEPSGPLITSNEETALGELLQGALDMGIEHDPAAADRERARALREAVLMMLAYEDGPWLPADEDIDDLFDRGLLRQERDITDEYRTTITPAGREFIREAVSA